MFIEDFLFATIFVSSLSIAVSLAFGVYFCTRIWRQNPSRSSALLLWILWSMNLLPFGILMINLSVIFLQSLDLVTPFLAPIILFYLVGVIISFEVFSRPQFSRSVHATSELGQILTACLVGFLILDSVYQTNRIAVLDVTTTGLIEIDFDPFFASFSAIVGIVLMITASMANHVISKLPSIAQAQPPLRIYFSSIMLTFSFLLITSVLEAFLKWVDFEEILIILVQNVTSVLIAFLTALLMFVWTKNEQFVFFIGFDPKIAIKYGTIGCVLTMMSKLGPDPTYSSPKLAKAYNLTQKSLQLLATKTLLTGVSVDPKETIIGRISIIPVPDKPELTALNIYFTVNDDNLKKIDPRYSAGVPIVFSVLFPSDLLFALRRSPSAAALVLRQMDQNAGLGAIKDPEKLESMTVEVLAEILM
ncbi:MAG TPA: hypothetical protein VJ044_13915 [Candidatus Hodarchaeales archaeon]|nr:hypothetical protein [Candidatus Hodarchaeales archaeon]